MKDDREEPVRRVLDFLRKERVPRSLSYIEYKLDLGKEDVLAATAILYAKQAITRIELRAVGGAYSETSLHREYWACSKSAFELLDAWEE